MDPTCPAKELIVYNEAAPASFAGSEYGDLKRDVGAISRRDYTAFGGLDTILNLPAIFNGGSDRSKKESAAWDKLVGDTNLKAQDYLDIYDSYPEYDPTVLTLEFLCSWDQASTQLQDLRDLETEACELIVDEPNLKRDLAQHHNNSKRIFNDFAATNRPALRAGDRINTGALMDAIVNNDRVHFLYARTINYQRRGNPNLEVAYDLRNRPDLQHRPNIDIFAVFHFHINTLVEIEDPELFLQIPYFHVFHGQRVYNANPAEPNNPLEWRVDFGRGEIMQGPGGPNQRTRILRCPNDRAWYPGHQQAAGGPANTITQAFGATLRAQGKFYPVGYITLLLYFVAIRHLVVWCPALRKSTVIETRDCSQCSITVLISRVGILSPRTLDTYLREDDLIAWIWDPTRQSDDWPNSSPFAAGPADMRPSAGWPRAP